MGSFEKPDEVACSVVIPLYNETDAVEELYERLTRTMRGTGLSYELVLVDDGSDDGTLEKLRRIVDEDENVVVVQLRRNFGKAAALAAGFETARGRVVVSMDGDLQHRPEDIPGFVEKIEQGYDLVNSWRKKRVDNLFVRRIPSRIANWIASKITGLEIHDFGGGFKAYRRELVEELSLYGEMHRFVPALAHWRGAKIAEVPIETVVRPRGKSKYGLSRTFRVAFDLITLRFLLGYVTRPLHFFGRIAGYCIGAAVLMSAYMFYDKVAYHVPVLVAHAPLAGLSAVLFLTGLIFIATGLLGEMMTRVYFDCSDKKGYSIRGVYHKAGSGSG